MGYTHYYGLKKEIKEIPTEALKKIKKVIKEYKEILRSEYDEETEAIATKKMIRFNGIEDEGHETFYFDTTTKSEFCKTAMKAYDLPCSIVLLLLFNYIPEFELASDGLYVSDKKVELDGNWSEAFEIVKTKFGIEFEVFLDKQDYLKIERK